MSGLIKSGNVAELSAVRPLLAPGASPFVVSRQEEEHDRLRQRITSLEAELRQRDSSLADLRAETARAVADATEEGRASGLAEAEDREAQRLALLEASLTRAETELSDRLKSFERLSALVARECLDILLNDPEHRVNVLRKMISAQTAKIEKSVLIGIELSREDFPDSDCVAALARRLGLSATKLSTSADVPEGGCTVVLRLGHLEIGIGQQWGVLRDLLADISLAEDAA